MRPTEAHKTTHGMDGLDGAFVDRQFIAELVFHIGYDLWKACSMIFSARSAHTRGLTDRRAGGSEYAHRSGTAHHYGKARLPG